jgi:Ser/Thr protein kinase RdoA (MazF antagonist)
MADPMDALLATMIAPPRPVSIERALALVQRHYGFEASATRLTGERDENFRLTVNDGREYVLKIANPAEDAAESDLQVSALLHIEKRDPALPCPRVLRDRTGGTLVRFLDEGEADRTARILTFLPGRLLGASTRSQRQRAACGKLAARLALALRDFEHPAANRMIVWDVRHTGQMRALLDELTHFPYQSAARELLERIVPHIDSQLPQQRQQVLHNDLNPLNILVEPDDEARVAGVIDFGDMARVAVIADVAVCAAELIPTDCVDPREAHESILDVTRAYHACMRLLPDELALLGALVAARLLMTLVIHEWHVQANPGSGHFKALDENFMRTRLHIAERLLLEEIRL